jgi:hypothetical protein
MTALMAVLLLFCFPLPAQKSGNTPTEGLTVFTYKIPVRPSEFVQQEKEFKVFADRVANDAQSILDRYEIIDKLALKEIYDVLLSKAVIDGNALKVLDVVYKRRALEENPSDRQLNSLIIQKMAESWMEKNSLDPEQIRDLFRFNLTEALNKLSWDTVADGIKQLKNRIENMTPDVMIGSIRSKIDPDYEKKRTISGKAAGMLLYYRSRLMRVADFRMDIIEVLDAYIRQNEP